MENGGRIKCSLCPLNEVCEADKAEVILGHKHELCPLWRVIKVEEDLKQYGEGIAKEVTHEQRRD